MPIVFVHGVAVRRQGDPGWEQVNHATGHLHWEGIEARLRQYAAPILQPQAPEQVQIHEIYWGDLGAYYRLGGRALSSWPDPVSSDLFPADLDPEEVGEVLERQFQQIRSVRQWPQVIESVWSVARDQNLHETVASLAPERQWEFLRSAVQSRLPRPELRELIESPPLPAPIVAEQRRSLRRTLLTVRRPIEDFVPLFLGDVMSYLSGRGTPEAPGEIMRRVIDGLLTARQQGQADEPLIVLTHSMGGQLMYDALTSFLPADPRAAGLRVDFWCACGSQVGVFREMGQFIERQPLPTTALLDSPHAGYFWNVWSYSDFLSFRTEEIIVGAHDTAFPFLGNVRSDHMAYLHDTRFYRALAAKIQVHSGRT